MTNPTTTIVLDLELTKRQVELLGKTEMQELVEKTIKINIPSIPNFLISQEGLSFPIAGFSDSDLKKIGKEWTEKLVTKAQLRREELISEALKVL